MKADMVVLRCDVAVVTMMTLGGRDVGVEVGLLWSWAGLRSNRRLRWHVGVDVHDDLLKSKRCE